MLKVVGNVGVIACTLGGYVLNNGHLAVLWQPFEFVIIFGSAVMAFLVANSPHTVKQTGKDIGAIYKKDKYGKPEYLELLSLLFMLFKMARTKGWLSLEKHIENPHESDIFKQFPSVAHDHHVITFITDYLRIISLGSENPNELETLMDQEIETMTAEKMHTGHAVQGMADGMPALGIVAAVLGVIHTMGSISEPPEILGHLIGGALVGTFLGVWLSYGFIAPIASAITERNANEVKYYHCIKVCILAFLQGAAPQVSIEFGRKILIHDVQPTFLDVEQTTEKLTIPTS